MSYVVLCSYCSCYVSVSKFDYFFFTSRSAPISTALPDSSPVVFARKTHGGSIQGVMGRGMRGREETPLFSSSPTHPARHKREVVRDDWERVSSCTDIGTTEITVLVCEQKPYPVWSLDDTKLSGIV